MASVEKILEKMRRQPNGISYKEIDKVLIYLGYELKRGKGDHFNYRKKGKPIYTLVKQNPVKKYLVDEVLKIIDES